jgi:hypothetical protein
MDCTRPVAYLVRAAPPNYRFEAAGRGSFRKEVRNNVTGGRYRRAAVAV